MILVLKISKALVSLSFLRYEKSYMHRDVVTHVAVSGADFFISGSMDGKKFKIISIFLLDFQFHYSSVMSKHERMCYSLFFSRLLLDYSEMFVSVTYVFVFIF